MPASPERKKTAPDASPLIKPNPLTQNPDRNSYWAGKTQRNKNARFLETYQKLWEMRRRAEDDQQADHAYDQEWLHIDPDELDEFDFYYFRLWDNNQLAGENGRELLQNEYWPRVKKHLRQAAGGEREKCQKMDISFNEDDFKKHDSKRNLYVWLLQQVGHKQ